MRNSETAWRCFWHSVIKNFQTTVNAAGNLLTGVLQSIVHHTQAKLMELEPNYTLMRSTHAPTTEKISLFIFFVPFFLLTHFQVCSEVAETMIISTFPNCPA